MILLNFSLTKLYIFMLYNVTPLYNSSIQHACKTRVVWIIPKLANTSCSSDLLGSYIILSRGSCESEVIFSGDPKMLEMPGMWNIC
jgi:hypothetical protein